MRVILVAIALMNRLRYIYKILLIGCVFFVPFIGLTYMQISDIFKNVDFSVKSALVLSIFPCYESDAGYPTTPWIFGCLPGRQCLL